MLKTTLYWNGEEIYFNTTIQAWCYSNSGQEVEELNEKLKQTKENNEHH